MLDTLFTHIDPVATGVIGLIVGTSGSLFLAALRAEGPIFTPSAATRRKRRVARREKHRDRLAAAYRKRELRRVPRR
jgi:hypothetical protein